jgi:hypothetical protein
VRKEEKIEDSKETRKHGKRRHLFDIPANKAIYLFSFIPDLSY